MNMHSLTYSVLQFGSDEAVPVHNVHLGEQSVFWVTLNL